MKFILGKKLGMAQIFNADGKVTPVTMVLAEPMKVIQIKTVEKDGYEAVQVETKSSKRKTKKKEFKGKTGLSLGEAINVSGFTEGDMVKVSAISKAKGFQGAVKRHGFHGMPASHGHKHVTRHVGSIGQRFPQHTLKGLRMAGRMGGKRTSVRGLKVIKVDSEKNILLLKGAVPGRKGTMVEIREIN